MDAGDKRIFNRRPAALAASFLACGILIAQNLKGTWLIVALCLFALTGALAAIFRLKDALIAAAALFIGLLRVWAAGALPAFTPEFGIFDEIRAALSARFDLLFGESAGILKAMILGDKEGVAYAALSSFRTAGIAHIFALSGLHVSFFAGAISLILKRCSHPLRFLVTAAFLAAYCAVCAFPASLVRATVMTLCLLFAPIAGRRADTLSSLGLAACIILLFAPNELFSAGFLMSFAAVFAIALFSRPLKRALRFLGSVGAESVALSLSASVGVLPLCAYFFRRVPLFSLPANLLLLPLAPVAVLCGFLAVALSFLWDILAVPFAFLGGLAAKVLTSVSGLVAELPAASVSIPYFSPYLCAFIYALLLIISPVTLATLKGRVYMACAAAGLCFVLSLAM